MSVREHQERLQPYLREYEEFGHVTLRAKWRMDGARTLLEAADQIRDFADEVEFLAAHGFELEQPVDDDYAFLWMPESPIDPPDDDDEDGWRSNGSPHLREASPRGDPPERAA